STQWPRGGWVYRAAVLANGDVALIAAAGETNEVSVVGQGRSLNGDGHGMYAVRLRPDGTPLTLARILDGDTVGNFDLVATSDGGLVLGFWPAVGTLNLMSGKLNGVPVLPSDTAKVLVKLDSNLEAQWLRRIEGVRQQEFEGRWLSADGEGGVALGIV